MTTKTVAEFFAGIGLMRLGLERAGWRVTFANDIDEDKREMYTGHFGDAGEFVLSDIHALDACQIPTVGLATASFPCNDLSLAGARQGLSGNQSSAFWGFVTALRALRLQERQPRLVLLENVPGFLTSHGGQDFEDALHALNELGYAVDALLIDASRFVPQSRQRLFVIGVLAAEPVMLRDSPHFHESEHCPAPLAKFLFLHNIKLFSRPPLPPLPKAATRLGDILEDLPLNHQMWWDKKRCDYLLGQMSPKHRAQAEAMIGGRSTEYATVFRRVRAGRSMAELRTDGIAGCLRTPRGGSGRQILFAAGKGRFMVRLLTPRECARLMGADDFRMDVPLNKALFGFGDAVCVPVIEWIGRHYLNPVWEALAGATASSKREHKKQERVRYEL